MLFRALHAAWVSEWQLGDQGGEVTRQRGAGEVCNPLLGPAELGTHQGS